MPNLLVHYAVQGPLSRALDRRVAVRWILLGCVIPDLPWIVQRAAQTLLPAIDRYDLRLYSATQASLAWTLLMCAAVALLSARPRPIFTLLAANALLHLCLDALQTKWANGVNLLAPVDWRMLGFDLFWPESVLVYAMTALGLIWLLLESTRQRKGDMPTYPDDDSAGSTTAFEVSRHVPLPRWVAVGALLLGWGLTPLAFIGAAERGDLHYVGTLRDVQARPGRFLELDRNRLVEREGGVAVVTFTGEELALEGLEGAAEGTFSIRGTFVDERTVRVEQAHRHLPGLRDGATYVGLLLFGGFWLAEGLGRRGGAGGRRAG